MMMFTYVYSARNPKPHLIARWNLTIPAPLFPSAAATLQFWLVRCQRKLSRPSTLQFSFHRSRHSRMREARKPKRSRPLRYLPGSWPRPQPGPRKLVEKCWLKQGFGAPATSSLCGSALCDVPTSEPSSRLTAPSGPWHQSCLECRVLHLTYVRTFRWRLLPYTLPQPCRTL